MPTNIQNVSFASPQALLAPDLSVEQQQAQRAQDLAAALRQMSMEPIDAGKGNIAWTQGAAKLAQALAGRIVQGRADKAQLKLNQAFAGRMGAMFGQPGGGGQASGVGGAPSPPSSIAPPAAPQVAAPIQPPPMRPQADPLAPLPEQPVPQQAPPQPQMALQPQEASQQPPQQPQRGPWSLSGDPRQDMSAYMLNPEEYGKAVIASHAPTDLAKMMMQAGIDPNSPLGHQLMQAQIAKQNYTAPVNGRPGSVLRDAYDPTHVIGYDPASINGAFPVFGADGMPTGYQQAPGAAQAMGVVAAAEAGGKGAGGAPYDLVTVVGPDGTPHQIPKSLLTGGGGAPSSASPAGGGGSLNGYYGRGGQSGAHATNQSGLAPQAQTAATTAGTNSANGFQAAIDEGAKSKDAVRSLNLIMDAAKGLPTGAGSERIADLKSGWNAVVGAVGLPNALKADPGAIAKFNEMSKNAANLAQQLSSGAGANGTDARLANALRSLPGAHYSPAAIQEVGLNLKGLASAANARSIAAANWQQQHGPGSYSQFQSTWQKAYNPDLFYHVQKGDLSKWSGGMSASARARVLDQYRTLKGLGAQF